MSALPGKRSNSRHLYMPELCQSRLNAPQQNVSLFDHVVGAERHVQAESLRGLEIDHKFELGGLHNWQVTRLLPFENSADIDAHQAIYVRQAVAYAIKPPARAN